MRVNIDLVPREGVLSDLNVIGLTVDEALTRAERFLDETLVTDQRTVRVIHGHGTGRLQKSDQRVPEERTRWSPGFTPRRRSTAAVG